MFCGLQAFVIMLFFFIILRCGSKLHNTAVDYTFELRKISVDFIMYNMHMFINSNLIIVRYCYWPQKYSK